MGLPGTDGSKGPDFPILGQDRGFRRKGKDTPEPPLHQDSDLPLLGPSSQPVKIWLNQRPPKATKTGVAFQDVFSNLVVLIYIGRRCL